MPGLVEAARLGGVSIVNTLGSGVLENPALMAFSRGLAEHLLGGPLQLPSVPDLVVRRRAGRRHVLAHLDRMVIKPITRAVGPHDRFGWELSGDSRGRSGGGSRPPGHVGRPGGRRLASAPTLTANGLEARRSVLRAFAVARGDSYVVMPGGLTRRPESRARRILGSRISNQAGAMSKDTWVLASEPEPLTGFWLTTRPGSGGDRP